MRAPPPRPRRPSQPRRGASVRSLMAALLAISLVAGCDAGATGASTGTGPPGAGAVSPSAAAAVANQASAAPVSSGTAAVASAAAIGASDGPITRYDPAKFGFAAKGLRGEVMAFVTTSQVDDALAHLDFSAVSTIVFFSLEASSGG